MSIFSRLFGRPKPKPAPAPAPAPQSPPVVAQPPAPAVAPPPPAADGTILVDGLSYCPFAGLVAPTAAGAAGQPAWSFAGKVEDRSKFRPPANEATVDLKATYGAFMNLGGRNVLIVIDKAAVQPGTKDWDFIHRIATTLAAAYPALDAQAKAALAVLNAVIYTKSPLRSFASVAGGWFFYDVDEFPNATPAFAASNIVHDANHVWQDHQGKPHTGPEAEAACWQLQVDNGGALGLQPYEVTYLQGLIANPGLSKKRMEENP